MSTERREGWPRAATIFDVSRRKRSDLTEFFRLSEEGSRDADKEKKKN